MFNIPAADDVLPSNKNHGLNPSDDPLLMMRKCYPFKYHRNHVSRRYHSENKEAHLRSIRDEEAADETHCQEVFEYVIVLYV